MDVQIRQGTLDDVPTLIKHRREMFAEIHPFDPAGLDAMDAAFREWLLQKMPAGLYVTWLAVDDTAGILAGVGVLLRDRLPGPTNASITEGHVVNVWTEPAWRGQGLAHRLMSALLTWCRDNGYLEINLTAAPKAIPIYESLGFEHFDRVMGIHLPS